MKKIIAAGLTGMVLGAGAIVGAQPDTFDTVSEVAAAQDAYFHRKGEYFLSTRGKNPRAELGKGLKDGCQLYTYISPREEKGWWIECIDAGNLVSQGFGVLAQERTYIKTIEPWVASTTP